MSNWWENDPIAGTAVAEPPKSKNWWESDPVAPTEQSQVAGGVPVNFAPSDTTAPDPTQRASGNGPALSLPQPWREYTEAEQIQNEMARGDQGLEQELAEVQAADAARGRPQSPYERSLDMAVEDRNLVSGSLPYRTAETLATNLGGGISNIALTAAGEGLGALADATGVQGIQDDANAILGQRESFRGLMRRAADEQAAIDEQAIIPGTGMVRQGFAALGEALIAGGTGGMGALAGYYAANAGASSLADADAEGRTGTGKYAPAAAHAVIEGVATLLGGKLGSGTASLAGNAGKRYAETVVGKAVGKLAERYSFSQPIAEFFGAAGAEVGEEVATEIAHYLVDKAQPGEYQGPSLRDRVVGVIGPSAIAGGAGRALDTLLTRVEQREQELPAVAELARKVEAKEPISRGDLEKAGISSNGTNAKKRAEIARKELENVTLPEATPQEAPQAIQQPAAPSDPGVVGETLPAPTPEQVAPQSLNITSMFGGMARGMSANLHDSWRQSLATEGRLPSTERTANGIPNQFWNKLLERGYTATPDTIERFIETAKYGSFGSPESAAKALQNFPPVTQAQESEVIPNGQENLPQEIQPDASGQLDQSIPVPPVQQGSAEPVGGETFGLSREGSRDRSPIVEPYQAPNQLAPSTRGERQPIMPGMPTDMEPGTLPGQQGLFDQPQAPAPPAAKQARPKLAGQDFIDQVHRTATAPEEANAIIALAKANAEYRGEDFDDYVAKTFAGVESADHSESRYLKQRGEDPETLSQKHRHGNKRYVRGEVQFLKDGRAVIRAFKKHQNAATLAHELGHVFRRTLLPKELATAERAVGLESGAKWKTEHEEKFARWFERYLRDGKAPNRGLKNVFEKFKNWLTSIYGNLANTPLKDEIPPPLRKVFDKMLTAKKASKPKLTGVEGLTQTVADLRSEGELPNDTLDDLDWMLSAHPDMVQSVFDESAARAKTENDRRSNLLLQWNNANLSRYNPGKMRLRELSGKTDESTVAGLDLKIDDLEANYPELAAEALKYGHGDVGSGMQGLLAAGKAQFDPVSDNHYLPEVVEEARAGLQQEQTPLDQDDSFFQAEGPQQVEPGDPRTTSARRVDVDRDRELLGLDAIDSPESRSWEQELRVAKETGIPARAYDIANSIVTRPRALSSTQTAGLVVRAAELKNAHKSLVDELGRITDPDELTSRSAELNRLEVEFDAITTALRTSGTEKGRALAAQKLTINEDYDLVSVLNRAKASKKDALTPKERGKLEEKVEKGERAKKRLDAHDRRQQHREVRRLRSAIAGIRKALGLDAAIEKDAAIPGLTEADQADLQKLKAKLAAADAELKKALELKPGERIHNRPSEQVVSELDQEIKRVKAAIRDKMPKKGADSAEAEAKRIEQLEKRLKDRKELLDLIDAGKPIPPAERRSDVPSEDRARVQSEIDAINKEIKTKRPPKEKDAAEVERKKIESLEKRLAEAQETLRKVKAGEKIDPKGGRRPDVMSEQRDKLHYELEKTRKEIRDAINELKPKSVWGRFQSLTDLSRGLITSIDYSALGRQAKFAAWAHPIIATKALPTMFRSGWSDQRAFESEQEILSRPNAHLYDLGMTIHRRDSDLTQREEAFVSKIVEKIPLVAGSQRAYVAFINRMRADVFDALAKAHGGDMGMTREEYKQLGHLVNVATGRGGFETAEPHMRSASLVLFAPRYFLSRIQWAIGQPGWHATNKVRKIVAQEYARTLIGAALWYGLYAAAFGDDDEFSLTFDPRSPDFGKIVLGNTRIDPMAGLAQVTRFAARMLSGQTIKNGRVEDMTPYDKWQEVSRFVRSKASPFVGQALNIGTGADVMGNPVDVTSAEGAVNLALGLVAPLSLRDIGAALEDQGVPRGTALSILNLFGEGLQVYANDSKFDPWGRLATAKAAPTKGDSIIDRWNASNPDASQKIGNPRLTYTIAGKQFAMSEEQADRYQKESGELANELVESWAKDFASNAEPSIEQVEHVKKLISKARTAVKQRMVAELSGTEKRNRGQHKRTLARKRPNRKIGEPKAKYQQRLQAYEASRQVAQAMASN